MIVRTLNGRSPSLAEDVFVADGVVLAGDVRVGAGASIWFNTVIRAEAAEVQIGAGTNIQDLSVVHTDPGRPTIIGRDVTVGHRAILHGCHVGDGAVIGMGAIVMNGASVGAGAVVAAGAVVLEDTTVPPGSLAVGLPARIIDAPPPVHLSDNASVYRDLAELHRRSLERTDKSID